MATLRSAEDVAWAIDDEIDERHGFHLSDLIEATLRYTDWRLEQLQSVWPRTKLQRDVALAEEEAGGERDSTMELESEDDESGEDDDEDPGALITERALRVANAPVSLSDAEVDLARRILGAQPSWLGECSDPERATRAWAWGTVAGGDVQYDTGSPLPISTALAANTGEGDVAFPASLALAFLGRAVHDLARDVAGDRECIRRIREASTARVITALGGEIEGLLPVVWSPGRRRAYVIASAVGLDEAQVQKDVKRQERLMRALRSSPERLAKRLPSFDPTGTVFPVLILGGHLCFRGELNAAIPRFQIQELIEMSQDCWQRSRSGGQALLWQFVEELHESEDKVHVLSHDMDDLWRLFLKVGSLNPAQVANVAVFPNPHPRPSRWDMAAQWEPYEDLLGRCGLVPRWKMHNTELEAEERVSSGWLKDWVITVAKDPDLVTLVKFDRADQEPFLDPVFAIGVADGIRLTLQNFDLWSHLSVPDGVVPLIRLEFDRSDDSKIGFIAADNRIALAPALGWVQYLAEEPQKAHEAVGQTVAECFARLGYLAVEARNDFLAGWNSAPPIAFLARRQERLQRPPQARLDLPRSIATKAHAEGRLATSVRKRPFEPGIYVDEYAFQVMTDVVEPAIDEALEDVLNGWSRDALMVLANQLNLVHAERYRRETEIRYAMSRPWRERWRKDALSQDDPSALTRPLEILMELFLQRQTWGTVVPDQFETAEAVDLVDKALRLQLAASAARNQLVGLMIGLQVDGLVDAFPRPPIDGLKRPKLAVDLQTYIEARRGFGLRDRAPEDIDIEEYIGDEPTVARQFTRMQELGAPERMLIADGFLKDHFGFGLDAVSAVMGAAVSWGGRDDEVRIVSKAELVEQATQWSQVPKVEILAATRSLTLTKSVLRTGQFEYWELESRSYRLAIRPLIEMSEHEVLLIPWLIHRCQEVFMIYMTDGRIPWPAAELSEKVRNAFNRYRQLMNEELERDVEAMSNGLGFATKTRIIAKEAAGVGLYIGGEIDALIADARRMRLWVCEVKDLQAGTSHSAIASGMRKFFGLKGYIQKLIDRHHEVSANVAGALRLLKVEAEPSGWEVRHLMITRRVEAAAFAYDTRVPFLVVSDLIKELDPG